MHPLGSIPDRRADLGTLGTGLAAEVSEPCRMIAARFAFGQMRLDSPFLIESQTRCWHHHNGNPSGGRLQQCRGDRDRALPGAGRKVDDNCC